MKLRINAKLRAALIAAITAVGFTLPQAAASTVLDGQTYSGDVYTWSNGGSGQVDLAFGGWKKTTQGDPGYIYGTEITTWDPTIKGLIANGGSTTFTSDLNTIRFATDAGSNTNMKYTFFPLSVGGIIAENAGYTITASGGNRAVYIGNATATAARSDIKGDFTINTSGAGDNGTMTFMGTQTWNVASDATFTLNSGKYAKTVDGSLSITGDGTVNLTGVTVIKKGSAIDVASGSSLVLNGTVNVMVDATDVVAPAAGTNGFGSAVADVPITGDGSLNTDGVTAWQINGGAATFNKDARTVSGETAVYFFQNADTASIDDAAGATAVVVDTGDMTNAVSIGGGSNTWATLLVKSGLATTTHDGQDGCVRGEIVIEGGGTFRTTAGHDAFGWGSGYGNSTKKITLGGDASKIAKLEIQGDNASTTVGAAIVMNGNASITHKDSKAAFNTKGCSITATGTNNTIDKMQIRDNVGINVDGATSTLEFGAMTKHGEGSQELTKTGDGTLTFAGQAQMNSLILNGGSVSFQGATTINGNLTMADGTTVTNSATLTFNNSGTIKIAQGGFANSGTVNFSSSNVFDLSLLTDNDGVYTLFTGTDVDLSKYSFTANNITGVETIGKNWTFGNNGTISYTTSAAKIWTDGAGTGKWNYEDANWDGSKFEEGDVAQFNVYSEVTVNADVVAGGIQADSVVFISNDEVTPGSLTSPSVDVAEGAYLFTSLAVEGVEAYSVGADGAWSISADQTLAGGTGSGDGVINVMEGGSVTFTGTATEADWTRVASNDGTVTMNLGGATARFDMSDSSGVLAVSNGKVDYRSNLDNQTLQLGSGSTLLFGDNDGAVDAPVFTNDIVLAGDATIQVYGTSKHSSVTISGDVTGADYTLTKDDGNQTTTFEGQIKVNKFVTGDNSTGTTVIKNGATIGNNLTPHKGILEIHGDVSVGHELDLSNNGACTATVKIAADGAATVKDGMWMSKNAHVELLEGGKLALTNAGLSLVGRSGGGSVTTTADNGQYGVGNTTFTISGADVTATKAVTIGNKLTNSSISTGANAVTLSNTGNTLTGGTVAEGGSLSIAGGGLVGTAIANNGTLTFTGDITATGFTVTKGASGFVDVNGTFSTDGNGFEATSGDSITIVNNAPTATLTPNGHKVTQDSVVYTINADGTATSGESVRYLGYSQVDGAVNVSAIAQYAEDHDGACTAVVVSGDGVLNVDDFMAFVTANGGTVNFVEGAEVMYLSVSDDAKISGLTDFDSMQIAADKTATLDNQVTSGDVVFSATDGVKVTNTGEQAITYSLAQTDAQVTADTMTVDGDTGVEIANSLVVKEIVNNNADGLVLNGNVADGVTLRAAGGDIVMTGQTSNTVSVVDLDIAPGNAVTLMDGEQEEGTITVSGVLKGAEAAVYADLTLLGDSTLNVNGGGDKALTLGSMLTIDLTNGGLVNLDDDTLLALNNLGDGETLNLIVALDPEFDALTYGGDGYDGMWYGQMFNRAGTQGVSLQGDFMVYAQGDAFGLTKVSNVPEPTTGTLSLLALMALAARRRRK